LLAAAGYPNGFDMDLEWGEFQGSTWGEFVQLVARFLGDVGVRVKLRQLETSTWLSKAAGVQPYTHMLAAFSPIGAGPSFMDWVYLRYHGSFPKTVNREPIQDPKLDDLLTSWRTDPGDKRPQLQRAIWDHLRGNVYRITTIVPPHYRILPGDAVIMQLDQAAAPSPEVLKRARQELGLDRPFVDQYRTWIGAALQGDLGRSLISRRPVTQELGKRINLTTHLAVMS